LPDGQAQTLIALDHAFDTEAEEGIPGSSGQSTGGP
jgi:hypothetical protein